MKPKLSKKEMKLKISELEAKITDLTDQSEVDPKEMLALEKELKEKQELADKLHDKILGGDKPQELSKEQIEATMKKANEILNR